MACIVKSIQTSRPGKHGHAKCRIEAVGIKDGRKIITVLPGHDNIDTPIIEKKAAQVLSLQADKASVMDMESYETFDLDIPDDLKGQVVEGGQVVYWIVLGEKMLKQVK
jgi:translation initiation factor 5A